MLLVVLGGLGWSCGFALVGLSIFKGAGVDGPHLPIFATFGFAAGVALVVLRLAIERQLPRALTAGMRRRAPAAATPSVGGHSVHGAPSFAASVFGA